MDVETFGQALAELRMDDVRAIAGDLARADDTPAERLDHSRAVLVVERALRRTHRVHDGVAAALAVSSAVREVARREAIALPDSDVTRVARAAAQLARGLAADPGAAPDVDDAVRCLCRGWSRLACCAGLAA